MSISFKVYVLIQKKNKTRVNSFRQFCFQTTDQSILSAIQQEAQNDTITTWNKTDDINTLITYNSLQLMDSFFNKSNIGLRKFIYIRQIRWS